MRSIEMNGEGIEIDIYYSRLEWKLVYFRGTEGYSKSGQKTVTSYSAILYINQNEIVNLEEERLYFTRINKI